MAGTARGAAPLILVSVLLSGCARDGAYTTPLFPFANGFSAARTASPVLLGNSQWWQRLEDPVLNRLVAAALTDSLSLDLARERVLTARAAVRAVPGGGSIDGSARLNAGNRFGDDPDLTGVLGLDFGWILDPWGERASRRRAAGARAEAAEAERDSAQLLVLLSLGQAYVDLRYSETLLALRERERGRRLETLDMVRQLSAVEEATRLQLVRAQARVADIDAALPRLRAAVTARRNEIAVLTGRQPGTIEVPAGGQPVPRMSPEIGVPADLLRNRPDIRVAERAYYAAVAEIDQAEAARYPSLSLGGTLSVNAIGAASGGSYVFGPALNLPVPLDGSANAEVQRRQSLARQAHTEWRSTVLGAILEVENALVDYRAVHLSVEAAARAVRLNRETLSLTRDLVRRGDATLNELIDAEQALSDAELTRAETLQQLGRSFVALNVRLGAGHAVSDR